MYQKIIDLLYKYRNPSIRDVAPAFQEIVSACSDAGLSRGQVIQIINVWCKYPSPVTIPQAVVEQELDKMNYEDGHNSK